MICGFRRNMLYPLFIDFKGKKVLVVGGGRIGTRRAISLREHGAEVTVVSKTFTKELLETSGINLIKRDASEFEKRDLIDGSFFMVVTASDDKKVNEKLGEAARERGMLVNRADAHNKGDVVFPMVSRVCGHTMAYTTLGENPKLLKKIKKRIEDEFPKNKAKTA